MDLDRADVHLVIVEIAYVRRKNHMCIIGLYSKGGRILSKLDERNFVSCKVKVMYQIKCSVFSADYKNGKGFQNHKKFELSPSFQVDI
jgi:hypothetical protein